MNTNEITIDTEQAFKSIYMEVSAMQGLARSRKNQALLKNYGIDTSNFYPVIAVKIDIMQWVRILLFYQEEGKYYPARNILTSLKRIIIE